MNIDSIAVEPKITSSTKSSENHLYSKNGVIKSSILQEAKQAQMHNEPIYSVGVDKLQGYMSYKTYDVIMGSAINQGLDKASSTNTIYFLSKNGKHYASGKTYVVNNATVAVPPSTSTSTTN
jgi:hypothetical protein